MASPASRAMQRKLFFFVVVPIALIAKAVTDPATPDNKHAICIADFENRLSVTRHDYQRLAVQGCAYLDRLARSGGNLDAGAR